MFREFAVAYLTILIIYLIYTILVIDLSGEWRDNNGITLSIEKLRQNIFILKQGQTGRVGGEGGGEEGERVKKTELLIVESREGYSIIKGKYYLNNIAKPFSASRNKIITPDFALTKIGYNTTPIISALFAILILPPYPI